MTLKWLLITLKIVQNTRKSPNESDVTARMWGGMGVMTGAILDDSLPITGSGKMTLVSFWDHDEHHWWWWPTHHGCWLLDSLVPFLPFCSGPTKCPIEQDRIHLKSTLLDPKYKNNSHSMIRYIISDLQFHFTYIDSWTELDVVELTMQVHYVSP